MISKKPALIDVPVLLIFFARPESLAKVFEIIREARPEKLFLYQDGARDKRPDDITNIERCRKIVDEIDWECDVYRKYQERNIGCDPSEYIAQKWIFEYVNQAIILEDDDVPSRSFFPFCKELLEKYEHDERIGIICGMNHVGNTESNPYSYLFTRSGSIWGWATWKRNMVLWDEKMEFLDDPFAQKMLRGIFTKGKSFKSFIRICKKHKASGRAHYESILASSQLLNSKLNIVPTKNMISNIGIGKNSSHALDRVDMLPRGIRRVLFMKTHEIEFPLKHPKYVIEDIEYKKKVDRIMGNGYPLVRFYRSCESVIYKIIRNEFSSLRRGLRRRISRN